MTTDNINPKDESLRLKNDSVFWKGTTKLVSSDQAGDQWILTWWRETRSRVTSHKDGSGEGESYAFNKEPCSALLVPPLLPRFSYMFICRRFTHLSVATILVHNMKKNGRLVKRNSVWRLEKETTRGEERRCHKFHFALPLARLYGDNVRCIIKSKHSLKRVNPVTDSTSD